MLSEQSQEVVAVPDVKIDHSLNNECYQKPPPNLR